MRNSFYLKNAHLLYEGAFQRLNAVVRNGRIEALLPDEVHLEGLAEIDGTGWRVMPGFLDLHTHGADGVDVNAADAEGLRRIGRFFAAQGVAGWLCSILTDTQEQTLWCIEQARTVIESPADDGAPLLGIHLEGPCLCTAYKGAMPEHLLMQRADAEMFARYQQAAGGHIRYVTLSPENEGVLELVAQLRAMGIVCAMGHSGADYEQSMACVRAGVQSVTHLGNAMRLMHQHEPAIFGAALESDAYVEAICDGRHLHPGTVRLYLKAKGRSRVLAVTDSIMAAGLPDGAYRLGVNDIVVKDGDAQLPNGVRAGSTLTMHGALKGLMQFTGKDAAYVAPMLAENQARLMGWTAKGRIAPGYDADFVCLDENADVLHTISQGRMIYTRKA